MQFCKFSVLKSFKKKNIKKKNPSKNQVQAILRLKFSVFMSISETPLEIQQLRS